MSVTPNCPHTAPYLGTSSTCPWLGTFVQPHTRAAHRLDRTHVRTLPYLRCSGLPAHPFWVWTGYGCDASWLPPICCSPPPPPKTPNSQRAPLYSVYGSHQPPLCPDTIPYPCLFPTTGSLRRPHTCAHAPQHLPLHFHARITKHLSAAFACFGMPDLLCGQVCCTRLHLDSTQSLRFVQHAAFWRDAFPYGRCTRGSCSAFVAAWNGAAPCYTRLLYSADT